MRYSAQDEKVGQRIHHNLKIRRD